MKALHTIHNLNQSQLYTDWDYKDDEGLQYYRQHWGEVKTEMAALIGLNMVENLLLLIPLEYTG